MSRHLPTPEIILLRHFYAGACSPLRTIDAATLLRCSPEGARYQLEKLYDRGWILKKKQFAVYYLPVQSPKMRETILAEINEVLY